MSYKQDKESIRTFSGGKVVYKDMSQSEYTMRDITEGLASECRYAGQTKVKWNVLRHSLLVWELSYLCQDNPIIQLAALMHDAAEAFIKDIPSPLKSLLPDYKAVEKKVEHHIWETVVLYRLPMELKQFIRNNEFYINSAVKGYDCCAFGRELPCLFEGKSDPLITPLLNEDERTLIDRFETKFEQLIRECIEYEEISQG